MIKQLINTLRNFKRSPLLLFVSLPGLVIGLTASLLLMLYLKYETSYDKHFPNKDRVVRLYNACTEENATITYPICLREAYTEIPQQIPEIELATQLYRGGRNNVSFEKMQFRNQQMIYADFEFFDVFGLDLISGNKEDALKQSNTVVIAESLAKKMFANSNCLGKVIEIGSDEFTITGVIKDMPNNTHFHFDLLASLSTLNPKYFGGLEFFTYYLLLDNADFDVAEEKISASNNKILIGHFAGFMENPESGIERLPDLHMYSVADFDLSAKANITGIYILSFLAAFILLIAMINHINLFVLYGEKRSLEIGIRKSLGASFFSLVRLFYFETAILTVAAFAVAFLAIAATVAFFSRLIQVELNFSGIMDPIGIAVIIGFLLLLIFVAGAYPAIYLSKLGVINAIKGGSKTFLRKKWLSILSVLVQFSISVFLIVCLLIINAQLNFLKDIPLGFNSTEVIGISGFDDGIRKKSRSIKDEIGKLPFVSSIGTSGHFMGGGCSGQGIYVYGESEENSKDINEYRVQAGYCETMKLQLESGRFFDGSEEDRQSIILNQAAVKMMGWDDPVGKYVVMHTDPLKIIGVVKDFYYNEYAGESIEPLALTAYSRNVNVFYLKVYGGFGKERQQQLADIFTKFDADYHFKHFNLDEVFKRKFSSEDRLLMFLFYGTFLAIFLSFIGMFALSVFNVEKRTKEIGIRKVLGSSSTEVLIKLLKDILKWVLWSMVPAFLISYILMKDWLMGFVNRIDLGVGYFLIGGFVAIVIAVVAISIRSISAARRNPVESLRYE